METRIHDFQIAPRVDDVPRRVEFDDGRRQSCGVQIAIVHVLSIQNQDMVLSIDAHPTEAAKRPLIGQRLGPGEVRFVVHGALLRVYYGGGDRAYTNREDRGRRAEHERSRLHVHWSVPFTLDNFAAGRRAVGHLALDS